MTFYRVSGDPTGFEQVAVAGSVVTPTATAVTVGGRTARKAIVCVLANDICVTFDGTAPTATKGMKVYSGDTLFLEGADLIANLKMIQVSAAATANITYLA
jgi:hypothetical protein